MVLEYVVRVVPYVFVGRDILGVVASESCRVFLIEIGSVFYRIKEMEKSTSRKESELELGFIFWVFVFIFFGVEYQREGSVVGDWAFQFQNNIALFLCANLVIRGRGVDLELSKFERGKLTESGVDISRSLWRGNSAGKVACKGFLIADAAL